MKKTAISLLLLASMSAHAGWFESTEVKEMKMARLDDCSEVTLEQMVNSYMGSPSWESFDSGNEAYVNIEGTINLRGKRVNAVMQFHTFADGTFEYNAFELNNIPQNDYMAMGLLNNMCEAARKRYRAKPKPKKVPENTMTKVTAVDYEGEAVVIKTQDGTYRMNYYGLTEEQIAWVEAAASHGSKLCFVGTDPVFKDDIKKVCN